MELLKKLALQAKEAFLKLSTAKKAIVAGVVVANATAPSLLLALLLSALAVLAGLSLVVALLLI